MSASLEPGYFDRLYAADPDPWRFTTSDYEDAKYTATLAVLPRALYANAVEVGCSIGVLTARLATRCDRLLGIDIAQAALDAAAARCAGLTNVRFERATMPNGVPAGRFDLVMLSEVLYYFDGDGVDRMAAAVGSMAAPEADIMLVHWLGPTPDYPLTGNAAVGRFLEAANWATVTAATRTRDYRIDLLRAR